MPCPGSASVPAATRGQPRESASVAAREAGAPRQAIGPLRRARRGRSAPAGSDLLPEGSLRDAVRPQLPEEQRAPVRELRRARDRVGVRCLYTESRGAMPRRVTPPDPAVVRTARSLS